MFTDKGAKFWRCHQLSKITHQAGNSLDSTPALLLLEFLLFLLLLVASPGLTAWLPQEQRGQWVGGGMRQNPH